MRNIKTTTLDFKIKNLCAVIIKKIEKISKYKNRIKLYNLDASDKDFAKKMVSLL